MSTLERTIATHLASTRFEDLPPEAVQAVKNSIIDTFGVMLAASATSDDCRRVRDLSVEIEGRGESRIVGYGDSVPASLAALVNGALCHPLDFDDTHEPSKCHTSAASIPAALALAQNRGKSGRDLIRAIALGSDLAARVAGAVTLGPTQHGWMGTAIYGHFGGSAAAGAVLGLDADHMLAAIGIAFCQTGGSREMTVGSSFRGIRDGFPQKIGVMSAQLAEKGMTGPPAFFTGQNGLYPLYFKGKYRPEVLTDGLGTVFEGTNVSFKLWPTCRLTHTYIESLLGLLDENRLAAGDVREIRVVVSEWGRQLCEPRDMRYRPRTEMAARDSFPFTLGLALEKRSLAIADFAGDALSDPRVLAAADRVAYDFDAELDPASMSPGNVTVVTSDGTRLTRIVTNVYGSPQSPISADDLAGKFLQCVRFAGASEDRAHRVLDMVARLETLDSVTDLHI